MGACKSRQQKPNYAIHQKMQAKQETAEPFRAPPGPGERLPNFASKYSLESSRRDLYNALLCSVLESTGENWGKKGLAKTTPKRKKTRKREAIKQRAASHLELR